MANLFDGYRCSLCDETYSPGEVTYKCPKDGGNLDVILEYDKIRKLYTSSDFLGRGGDSFWHFLPLLPISEPVGGCTPIGAVGQTPMYRLKSVGKTIGLHHLWVKDESRNPTASFKDRASAVVTARALEIRAEVVVTASTGNAGAALAGMAAAVGQKAVILAPRTAPAAKVAQLLVYGAGVYLVEGSYDDAFDLSIEAAHTFGWYCRNTGYNPFTVEGKKTAAFEIWSWWQEQDDRLRDRRNLNIFVSVGDGNIISGLHKGFKDLQELGWLTQMPRIFGVQAAGSAAIAQAFETGSEVIQPVAAETVADSISVNLPADGVRAVRAARQTGGRYIRVEDDEILAAIPMLGKAGIFAEPAGAAGFAGMLKAVEVGMINPDEPVVVLNTGSGLKDVRAAMDAVPKAAIIEPTIDALKRSVLK